MVDATPQRRNQRQMIAFAALALLASIAAAGARDARSQTISITNCANPLLDGNSQPFGCLLSELADANGGTIAVEPTITPPVRIEFVFDQNSFRPQSAGVQDTNPAGIAVVPVGLNSNRPGLEFTDLANHWRIFGGSAPNFQTNNKNDVIEFAVVARDPQTNQPTARIEGAEIAIQTGLVSTVDPGQPSQAAARDIVSDYDIANSQKLGSLTPGGLTAFRSTDNGERLRETRSLTPRKNAVHFQKEVKIQPGVDVGNRAELDKIFQYVLLSADKKVGCLPGTIMPATGGQTAAEVCALPSGQRIPPGAGPFAQGTAGIGFGTDDPNTGGGLTWHEINLADNGTSRAELIIDLETLFPRNPGAGSVNEVMGFDFNDTDQLTFGVNNIPPSGLIDFSLVTADLPSGQTALVVAEGNLLTIEGILFDVRAIFGNQTTDNTVFANLSLNRNGVPSADGVVGFDLSKVLDGSGPAVTRSYLSGASLDTPSGTDRLGDVIDAIAAHDKADHVVLQSVDFRQDQELFILRNGRRSAANRISGTGDPINAASDEVLFFNSVADVNANADAAFVARTAAPGASFPTGSAGGFWSLAAGAIWAAVTGEEVPGIPGSTIVDVLAIGLDDNGRGALTLADTEAGQTISKVALLPYSFDAATGQISWDPPVLTTGDTVDYGGSLRIVSSIAMDPRGVSESSVAVSALFDDNTDAVMFIPLSTVVATVPDLTGFDQASAEALIVADGFIVGTVTTQSSDTVPAGDVIAQSPAPGTVAAPGSAVDLVVSSGPALAVVPDVLGLTQADAEAAIVAAGLIVGTISAQNSDTVPAGETIAQNPAAGAQVPLGSTVDLSVSLGPAPVMGDIDGDGDVDRDDINLILAARNQPASGPDDPRDLDSDGVITVLDARKAVVLCTRPGCAT